jgi:phage-related tail protein
MAMDKTMESMERSADEVGSQFSEIAERTKSKVQEWSAPVREKTQQAMAAAGEKMESLAGAIRDRAPQEGSVATAAATVADKLEGAGAYLQERGIPGAVEDLSVLIRRYPVQSLLIGIGIGYLLARLQRR